MNSMISSSIMCANLGNLESALRLHEEAAIEYIHVDIMDGNFVPNYTFGPDFCKALRGMTKIPLDIHLMINQPERYSDIWDIRQGDIVSLHLESTNHIQRALAQYKSKGAVTAIAINPGTQIANIEEILPDVDIVLLMTVNPGFAGQKIIPQMFDKIQRMRDFLDSKGYGHIKIQVDGNVSFENARIMRSKGADIFVAGSSSIFNKDISFVDAVNKFRSFIV